MSIAEHRFWEPVLDIHPTSGFPEQVLRDFNDRILSFTIEDDHRYVDKAELTLDNGDGALIDPASVSFGMLFRCSWGYPGAMSVPRSMECRKITGAMRPGGLGVSFQGPHTAAGGAVTLHLYSELWKMNRYRSRANPKGDPGRQLDFRRMSIPQIVREIALRNGFSDAVLRIDGLHEEASYDQYTIPERFSDAEWVQDQARRRGWTFSTDASGFHFRRPGMSGVVSAEILRWFAGDPDVIEWEIDGDLNVAQFLEASGSSKEVTLGYTSGSAPTSDESAAGQSLPNEGGESLPEDEAAQSVQTQEVGKLARSAYMLELAQGNKNLGPDRVHAVPNPKARGPEAVERAINLAIDRWTLKLKLVGNPFVLAREAVKLENFGPMMDGFWWNRKVKHTFSPGTVYITEVEAKRKSPEAGQGIREVLPVAVAGPGGKYSTALVELKLGPGARLSGPARQKLGGLGGQVRAAETVDPASVGSGF